MLTRIALAFAAVTLVSLVIYRLVDYRIGVRTRCNPAEFRAKDLRVNTLLADVPLHDVWVARLRGGGEGRSIREARSMLAAKNAEASAPVAAALFRLRLVLGGIFAWDEKRHFDHSASYIHRLTERDWRQSYDEPGQQTGMFRTVYTFERESVAEIINGTVHAFLAMVLEPTAEGYTLYHAVYVKPVCWITPYYMALIDPFRKLFIYPSMMKTIERAWVVASSKTAAAAEPRGRKQQADVRVRVAR